MKKFISAQDAAKLIPDNATVMIGGFLRCGSPKRVIDAMIERKTSGLTLIANDTGFPDSDRGKLIVNKMVKKAADGHGGTLKAMGKEKIIKQMKEDGIEWVFVSGVDNVLVKSVDPLLLGMSIDNKVLGSVKTIEKTDPKEKVGVFCRKNKKVGVIEYTEISDEMAQKKNDRKHLG